MPLDSATTAFLAAAAEAAGPDAQPMWTMAPADARLAAKALTGDADPVIEMVRTEDHLLTSTDGGQFEVRVHVPVESPDAVFIYLHGGGWVLQDIDGYDALGRQLAERSGYAVVLVNYRKAPEHPFPLPVEDSWTALTWTAEHLTNIAGRDVPLIIGGDSAGGNLAAAMTLRARDHSGPALAVQVLIYPVTDADFTRSSYLEAENQTLLTTEFMSWFWDQYVPDAGQRRHPEAAPLHAGDLSGLPPALIITAAHDVLRDEGEAYAAALEAAGVPVNHKRWEGQMHGFITMLGILPASTEVLDHIVESVSRDLEAVTER
ncbi:alpha/beta hydrolase [Arthrobacter sp. NPDC055585]